VHTANAPVNTVVVGAFFSQHVLGFDHQATIVFVLLIHFFALLPAVVALHDCGFVFIYSLTHTGVELCIDALRNAIGLYFLQTEAGSIGNDIFDIDLRAQ
jgi:hypothetical protein